MRPLVLAVCAVCAAACSHVAPASTKDVPPPWPAARPDAGTPPDTTTPQRPTMPSPPSQRGGVTTTPGGAVIKPGTPPPVVPLTPPAPSTPAPKDTVDRTHPPPPGPTPPLNLPVPARRTLANGATLLVVERHQLPLASIVIVWPYGAADEAPAQAGLAGLTADLLDEGAGTRGPLELADAVERLGARVNTGAGWDATTVGVTTMTRELDAVLPLVADIVARPRFDEAELTRVRAERLTTLEQQHDAPPLVAAHTLARVLYGEQQRYGEPLIGTRATLGKLDRAAVVAWARERLRPDVATIIAAGDVTPDDLARRLDRALAGWSAPKTPRPRHPSLPAPAARRRVVLVDRPGAAQTVVRVGLPGPPRKTPDFFACLVANAVLGGQFSSRLNMNLRERHGYTYGASSEFSFRRDGGPFVAGAPVKTAVTADALKETLDELARLRATPVGADELALAKDELSRAIARAFATPPEVALALVAQAVEGLPDDYFKTYAAHVRRVTAADVRRAAARWIDPRKASIVLVGDEAAIGTDVNKLVGPYQRESDSAVSGVVR